MSSIKNIAKRVVGKGSPGPVVEPKQGGAGEGGDTPAPVHIGPMVNARKGPRPNQVIYEGKTYSVFFLCGHAKSGTNWVGALLNLHPQINCRGEFHFQYLFDAFKGFVGAPWHVAHKEPTRSVARAAMHDVVRKTMVSIVPGKPDALLLGDRSPRKLEVLLPESPHLFLVRDGRDVLISYTYHMLRVGKPEIVPRQFQDDFARYVGEFKDSPEKFRDPTYGLLGDGHWVRWFAKRWTKRMDEDHAIHERLQREGARATCMRIRYEDLHANTETGRAEIYRFLGLNPDEAAPLSVETRTLPGFDREDPSSFFRKGQPGDWKNYATDSFRKWFKTASGDALIRYGYEQDDTW